MSMANPFLLSRSKVKRFFLVYRIRRSSYIKTRRGSTDVIRTKALMINLRLSTRKGDPTNSWIINSALSALLGRSRSVMTTKKSTTDILLMVWIARNVLRSQCCLFTTCVNLEDDNAFLLHALCPFKYKM